MADKAHGRPGLGTMPHQIQEMNENGRQGEKEPEQGDGLKETNQNQVLVHSIENPDKALTTP